MDDPLKDVRDANVRARWRDWAADAARRLEARLHRFLPGDIVAPPPADAEVRWEVRPPRSAGGPVTRQVPYLVGDDAPELFVPLPHQDRLGEKLREMAAQMERDLFGLGPEPISATAAAPPNLLADLKVTLEEYRVPRVRIERWGALIQTWIPCTAWADTIAPGVMAGLDRYHLYRLVADKADIPPRQFIPLGEEAGEQRVLVKTDGTDFMSDDPHATPFPPFAPPLVYEPLPDYTLPRRGLLSPASLAAAFPHIPLYTDPVLDPGPPADVELILTTLLSGAFGEPSREGDSLVWRPPPTAIPPTLTLADLNQALTTLRPHMHVTMYVRTETRTRIERERFRALARRNSLRHQRRNARWRHH